MHEVNIQNIIESNMTDSLIIYIKKNWKNFIWNIIWNNVIIKN
jgi:hypothetical protein